MTTQYETLRESALRLDSTPRPAAGLGVFVLRGMAGWLDVLPALVSSPVVNHPQGTPSDVAGSSGRSELVHVLADMVASCVGGGP